MQNSALVALPQAFFARECLSVAVDLLGKLLVHGDVVLRIAEVEAYRHPGDSANHCRAGRTARTAPMWGPAGYAYVYLCYGMHALLNLVTDGEGQGAAVLIRAAEPVAGHALIAARRGGSSAPSSLSGPGKLCKALAIDVRASGLPLTPESGLYVCDAPDEAHFRVGPRVGVDYASPADRDAPWRLALLESRWVSVPRTLRPWPDTRAHFLASQARMFAESEAEAHPGRAREKSASARVERRLHGDEGGDGFCAQIERPRLYQLLVHGFGIFCPTTRQRQSHAQSALSEHALGVEIPQRFGREELGCGHAHVRRNARYHGEYVVHTGRLERQAEVFAQSCMRGAGNRQLD